MALTSSSDDQPDKDHRPVVVPSVDEREQEHGASGDEHTRDQSPLEGELGDGEPLGPDHRRGGGDTAGELKWVQWVARVSNLVVSQVEMQDGRTKRTAVMIPEICQSCWNRSENETLASKNLRDARDRGRQCVSEEEEEAGARRWEERLTRIRSRDQRR